MAAIKERITKTVEDLKNKIEEVSNLQVDADDDTLNKVNHIKKKTTATLISASNKLVESIKSMPSIDEIEKSIDIINKKSNELCEYAFRKIDETISNSEQDDDGCDYCNNENLENEVVESVDIEVKEDNEIIVQNPVINEESDLSIKAKKILKEWFKPEGV